ncbi:MAG TPA: BON domain-containing protein [Methylophilaceae bacterium]|nr:BON domain-containing protein [Methylophilaceae bacterium]
MKNTKLKSLACITAVLFMPFVAIAGGTNTRDDPTTGEKRDPNKETRQGDMGGQGVGTEGSQGTTGTGTGTEGSRGTSDAGMGDDSSLSTSVQDAIKNDAMLRNLDIQAEVNGGVVTLTGDAKDVRFKARAAKVAKSVKGVKSVKNNITVGKK